MTQTTTIETQASLLRRLCASPAGVFSVVTLTFMVGVAIFAPLLAPYDPIEQSTAVLQAMGSPGHLLGTDDLGRDVLSRLIHGTRVSMIASFLAVGVALVIGVPMGIVAGYLGGWADSLVMRVVDTILSFPAIILALSLTAVLGAGLTNSMIAVGIVFSPSIARLMRGQVLAVKEQTYVQASTTFGARGWHIVRRHLLPNAIQPVLVQASLLLAAALIAEASLSFLGLGVQPPMASWGAMLARAYTFIGQAPLQMIVPGAAIAWAALGFNLLGDAAQDALDPKRTRHS